MKKSSTPTGIFLTSFFLLFILLSPLTLHAQVDCSVTPTATGCTAAQGIGTLGGIINAFTTTVMKALGGLFMAAGVVAFFYGIVEYIWGRRQGNIEKTKNGNQFMTWGLIALFVMFSVYGIIKFAQNIIMPGTDFNTITIPGINFGQSSKANPNNPNNPNNTGPLNNAAGGNNTSPLGGGGVSPVTGPTGNAAFDQCIASGGGVIECRNITNSTAGQNGGTANTGGSTGSCPTGYLPDDQAASGCSPDPSYGSVGNSGSCPVGYLPDDQAASGCSLDPSYDAQITP